MPSTGTHRIDQVIAIRAKMSPESPAIAAPGAFPLTYSGLDARLNDIRNALHAFGLGISDTVALSLPDGPEAAAATLAVASGARCAPLNPELRERELISCFESLGASALIVESGADTPARQAAERCGIGMIELTKQVGTTAAGFTLTSDDFSDSTTASGAPPDAPSPQDVALLLHTSGTTSKPKLVPLTHFNLLTAAASVERSLQLTPVDCCLNVMPLFHIHGLVGTLFSSLCAGASVVCCRGFQAPRILDWLSDFPVTWYSAVPAIHRSILHRARMQPEKVAAISLRLIRSASAPLAPELMKELEQTFSAPLLEAYGMTEAAHQICANPLPPEPRKPGSVGRASDTRISIIGPDKRELPAMQPGEVVIRGGNVMSGYVNDIEANRAAFIGSGLRTGDQGYLDADGYLFLTGRFKELINRAGEKIAPREIDEVLLEHPSVSEAVAFAIADAGVGEEIAAVVVPHLGVSPTAGELQEYAATRLASYKVPRRIIFRQCIPTGPSGKLQRIGLAEALALDGMDDDRSPCPAEDQGGSTTEEVIRGIWSDLLGVDDIEPDANFFSLGGDSVLATTALIRLQDALDVDINITAFFHSPTVLQLSRYIEGCGRPTEPGRPEADVETDLLSAIENMSEAEVTARLAALNSDQAGQPDEHRLPGTQENPSQTETYTGHKVLACSLKRLGITHVYAMTGTPINETLAECAWAGIRVMAVHNQSAGAQMAAAQNYSSGRLVAAGMMTAGPGIANAALGALVARDNGWPLLLIGGGRPQDQRGAGVFQDLDSISLYRPLAKSSDLVESMHNMTARLQHACSVAVAGKPGPVYLDVPEDVLQARSASDLSAAVSPRMPSPPRIDRDAVDKAAELLLNARRPVLLVDTGLRWGAGSFSFLSAFVQAFQGPIVTTHMARGFIADDHPLCCNRVVGEVCGQADLAIVAGGRLDWQFRFGSEIPQTAKIVQICSEPSDAGMGRAADLALIGHPPELLKEIHAHARCTAPPDRSSWIDELSRIRSAIEVRVTSEASADSEPMIPERLMKEIASCLPEDTIVVVDGNVCYGAAQRVIPALRPMSRFTSGQNGCIGVGIPFAVGAKLTRPDKPVIVITGDAAFGLCAMEIETAVRHKVDLVIVVANNGSPSGGKARKLYPEDCADEYVMYQNDVPYEVLTESLGGRGESVARPGDVVPALLGALRAGGVTCINVKVAPFTPIRHR